MLVKRGQPLGCQLNRQGAAQHPFHRGHAGPGVGVDPGLVHLQQRAQPHAAAATITRRQHHLAHPGQHAGPAREPAAGVVARPQRAGAGQVHRAPAGADAEHAAIAGGNPHRAAGVRPQREIHQPGRDCRGRPAGGAAGETVRRGGVDRGAVPDILAGQAIGQLYRLGLADQVGAGLQQAGHHRRGGRRHAMGSAPIRVAVGGDLAGNVEQVLHREGQSAQRPLGRPGPRGPRPGNEGTDTVIWGRSHEVTRWLDSP